MTEPRIAAETEEGYRILSGSACAGLVLLCDHACNALPDGSQRCTAQKGDESGNMANVFSSKVHGWQNNAGDQIFTEGFEAGRMPGDPATPLLRAYTGDRVQVRLIQGAQEENHIFTMHGVKWLSQPE